MIPDPRTACASRLVPTAVLCLTVACAERPVVGTGGPLISELLASNRIGLADRDGGRSDWIELFNDGPARSLAGWSLTTDPAHDRRWTLPEVTLGSGEFLLVFASGKDRRDPLGELHADFKLARSGEYLALLDAGGALASGFGAGYPPQEPDRSYGLPMRAGTDPPELAGEEARFLEHPSPAAPNDASGWSGLASEPSVVPSARAFVDALTVGLFAPSPRAHVRYALDGDLPGPDASTYERPFQVRGFTRLCARTFAPDRAPSPPVRVTYFGLDPALEEVRSELSLVLLRAEGEAVGARFAPMDLLAVRGRPGQPARFLEDPNLVAAGVVRRADDAGPGALRLELRDARGRDLDLRPLGMPAEADWVLLPPEPGDDSLLRTALANALARDAGRYAPRGRFCELWFQAGGERARPTDYRGVVLFAEVVEGGRKRVDLGAAGAEAGDARGALVRLRFAGAAPPVVTAVDPPEEELAHAERARALEVVRAVGARGPLAEELEPASWAELLLVLELTRAPAAAWEAPYAVLRSDGRLAAGPPGSLAGALGVGPEAPAPEGWTAGRASGWWGRLWEDPAFRVRCDQRWRQLRAGRLAPDRLGALVDGLAREVRDAQRRHAARWTGGAPSPEAWHAEHVTPLRQWLLRRAAWLDGALAEAAGG